MIGRHAGLPRTPGESHLRPATVAVSVAVVVAGSAAQLVDYALGLRIDALDSSEDGGVFGVVGDVAAAAAAGAAWLLLARVRPVHRAAVALPPLLTFIAVDKVIRLHDHIPHYLLVYAPVLGATFVCTIDALRRLPQADGRLVAAGLGLLAASFGLHLVGERLLLDLGLVHVGWARQVKAVVKHGCEVQGWFLLAIGLGFRALGGSGDSGVNPEPTGVGRLRGGAEPGPAVPGRRRSPGRRVRWGR